MTCRPMVHVRPVVRINVQIEGSERSGWPQLAPIRATSHGRRRHTSQGAPGFHFRGGDR